MADALGLLALLIGLEIVLGVDNVMVIAIFYLPMGFALMVEMLQMRYEQNRRRKKA
jgi:predicted tellurium resistance membrane protein TerC